MACYVAYLRVSTARQGESGLGLDAQREAIRSHAGASEVLAEFIEVETGKGSQPRARRPELDAALKLAKKHRATLIIAKLDRLARNVHFISGLMESKIDFVVCDMPMANRLTLHILAAVAEHEAQMISERTKAALGAAKARGVKLGTYAATLNARHSAKASAFAADLAPTLLAMRATMSQPAMVRQLNADGQPAPGGGVWYLNSLRRVMARI